MYVLLGYFSPQFFGKVGLSTDFLARHNYIVKTKLSTVKNLQFYLLMIHITDYLKTWVTKNLENPNVDGFEIYARKSVYILKTFHSNKIVNFTS